MGKQPLNEKQQNQMTVYESNGIEVKLSPQIIKNYLVTGGGNVTDQEVGMFLNLCKAHKLNPWLRECYLVKYGNQCEIITGKEAFMKRAYDSLDYKGFKAGTIVVTKDNELVYRDGAFTLPTDTLVGGWCKVTSERYNETIDSEVSFAEYCKYKDNKPSAEWGKKPATMIRKVAIVQAMREAFPKNLGGMYIADEISVDESVLDNTPIESETVIIDVPPIDGESVSLDEI